MTPSSPAAPAAMPAQATAANPAVWPPLRPIVSALLRSKTGPLLIVLQVALTLAILCNALFVAQQRLQTARLPSGVPETALFYVETVTPGYDDTPFDLQRRDEALVRAVPGVLAASWVNQVPLSNEGNNTGVATQRGANVPQTSAAIYRGGAALLDTLGLRLVAGRALAEDEVVETDRRVEKTEASRAIISTALAARLFPDLAPQAVVGRTVFLGAGDDDVGVTVVGVVERLVSPWGPAIWNPGDPDGQQSVLLPSRTDEAGRLLVRAAPAEREAVRQRVLAALREAAPDRVIVSHAGVDELRGQRFADDRWLAGQMLVAIGLLLVMTAGGIVALASLWVTQRRRQIGVRRALGARRRDIVGHFLAENLMITATGTLLGLTLALALNQALVRIAGLQPLPGSLLAVGGGAMLLLGLLAVLPPALRAARLPPAEATRGA